MSLKKLGTSIIGSSVGTKQTNARDDVYRVQQLLRRSGKVLARYKGFAIDGRWNEETEEALASGIGLFFAAYRDAEVRPLPYDPNLMKIAGDAKVAIPLFLHKGKNSLLKLHASLVRYGVTYEQQSVVFAAHAKGDLRCRGLRRLRDGNL